MQRDLVEERKWVSKEDYFEGLAFSQLCPGPLAAQLAKYIGWLHGGTLGATLVRLGIPVVIGLAATSNPGKLRDEGFFGFIVAFYLINLQEFKEQISLSIARDRVIGILLGLRQCAQYYIDFAVNRRRIL